MIRTVPPKTLPPRHLVLRSQAKVAVSADAVAVDPITGEPRLADPGDMQLYSFFAPSLVGGLYTITADQKVTVPVGPSNPTQFVADLGQTTSQWPGAQQFEVVAPQFIIDPSDIHSTYPPQGHADQPSILPHIVFSEEHLPWERELKLSSSTQDAASNSDLQDITPWLAVLPFDCTGPKGELRLTNDQLNGPKPVYTPADGSPVTLSSKFSMTMTVAQYLQLGSKTPAGGTTVHVPPYNLDGDFSEFQNDITPVQVIFLSADLFLDIFSSSTDRTKIDMSKFRYVAHSRNINTFGMANAGVQDQGIFSIIHSLRTGPTDIAQNSAPRSQTVHLISLEFIDQISIPAEGDLVALLSLYSWTYLCQPPLSVNFIDKMRAIGEQVDKETCMLRCSDSILATLAPPTPTTPPSVAATYNSNTTPKMLDRMNAGYSLIRQRLATGEQTVAFTRSPLIPVLSQTPSAWPAASTNGQNYQILDNQLGIMDVSYSAAWQLGKTMASSDMGFVAALMRIRATVHSAAAAIADFAMLSSMRNVGTKTQTMQNLHKTTAFMHAISKPNSVALHGTPSLQNRWSKASVPMKDAQGTRAPDHPTWQAAFTHGVQDQVKAISMASTGDVQHNDTTAPVSTDWAFLQNWIVDKLFLHSIPSHYLVTDPLHLPPETIRFFHLDPVWMDCLIDGALSVANHLARDDDAVRQSIKVQLNSYLANTNSPVQVPIYGFLLRSAVVHAFPDLQVTVPFTSNPPPKGRAPVLAQKIMGKDILLVLLDRLPDDGDISTIRISQPPHQQCFGAGDNLDGSSIEFLFKKVYLTNSSSTPDFLHEFGDPHTWKNGDASKPAVYDWNTRCLNFSVYEKELFNTTTGLPSIDPEWNTTPPPNLNSSMVGMQLNDTIKYLEFTAPSKVVPAAAGLQGPRQLYIGPVAGGSALSTGPIAMASISRPATIKTVNRTSLPTRNHVTSSIAQTRTQEPLPKVPQTVEGPHLPAPHKPAIKPLASLPTHLQTLSVPVAAAALATAQTSIPSGGSHPPQFTYAIYPSTVPFAQSFIGGSKIPLNTPYAPDIIFSINLPAGGQRSIPGLYLREIDFKIPIGDPSLRKARGDIIGGIGLVPAAGASGTTSSDVSQTGAGNLPQSSTTGAASPGSGARMLSNQRWVVHMDLLTVSPNTVPSYLMLRLIPRTLNMTVPILQNQSLSFKLNEVEVAGPDGSARTTGNVIIEATEKYGKWNGPVAGTGQFQDMGIATSTLTLAKVASM